MVEAATNELIASNKVMMFSKSWCPHCNTAKQTLTNKGIQFAVQELDQVNNGNEIQAFLLAKTQQRTVPSIFINQEHIGGNSDLTTIANNGQLDAKMAE